jgi:hypothetical protein
VVIGHPRDDPPSSGIATMAGEIGR